MTKRLFLNMTLAVVALLPLSSTATAQVTVTDRQGTDIQVTFFTPRTVHITKTPQGKSITRKSMVVTTQPQNVSVNRNESGSEVVASSNELTVRVNKTTGRVSFEGRRIKNLLSEESFGFEERTSGPDKGAYRVTTAFRLQKDEPIYGLGTLQDGKLSHRGKHVDMEQSNLQDFQNVFQSIRGWAIYWDNYSRPEHDYVAFVGGGRCCGLLFHVGWLGRWQHCRDAHALRTGAHVPPLDLRLLAVKGAL